MIPDAAVEAAFCALFPNEPSGAVSKNSFWLPTITAILEAAAPHMRPKSAVECDGSYVCASTDHIEGCFSTNPNYPGPTP